MHFAHAEILWLLLGVVGLGVFVAQRERQRIIRRSAFASAWMMSRLAADYSPRREWVKTLLVLAALAFLVIGLAGPRWGSRLVTVKRQGIDVVVAVDCSSSMDAQDVKPSRLAVARRELGDLIGQLEGNRLGLVGFAGTAFPFCPLTLDMSATRLFLDQLDPASMPIPGTSLGAAIETALQTFPPGDQNQKAIVLLTDGEDHHSDPIGAATQAARAGVRIYTVGVGNAAGVPIPEKDETGRSDYVRDSSGHIVTSRLDEGTLQHIANLTGGLYVHVDGTQTDALAPIIAAVHRAPQGTLEETLEPQPVERFQLVVLLAIGCLAMESWVTEAPRAARQERTAYLERSNTVKTTWRLSGWLISLLAIASVGAAAVPAGAVASQPTPSVTTPPRAINPFRAVRFLHAMQHGKADYDKGDFAMAQREFESALAVRPDSSEARLDLGQAQYRAGQFAAANQTFDRVADPRHRALQALAAYDTGNSLYRQNKLPEAATAYEKALRYNDRDEDARFNLQVVLDKLQQHQQPSKSSPSQNKKPQDPGKSPQQQSGQSKGQQGKAGQSQAQQDKSKGQQSKADQPQAHQDKSKDKQGKAGQQAHQDKSKDKQGKADQQLAHQDKSTGQQDKSGDQNLGSAHSRPSAPGGRAPVAIHNVQNGSPQDDTERVLEYYRDQERQVKIQRVPPAPYQPQAGDETW